MTAEKPGTVLITGASYGIGYALAHKFAAHGHPLVLVARSEEKLCAVRDEIRNKYNLPVTVLVKDLTHPLAPEEVYRKLKEQSIEVDILVNNAGFGGYGPFAETDLNHELSMMQLNMTALTHLTKLFLKRMVEQRNGKVLNVASTAAFQPGPIMAVYYATKAYVLSFSRGLREELRGSGVSVTCLCPGPTSSEFQTRASIGKIPLFNHVTMTSSEFVARKGYEGAMSNKSVVIPGAFNQLMAFSAKISPACIVSKVVHLLQKSKKQ